MIAMHRQSLSRPATAPPPSIGLDARHLWRAGPAAAAAGRKGQSDRLGAAPSSITAGAAGGEGRRPFVIQRVASALNEALPLHDSEPVVDAA
jgi:hypothetical protein